MPERKKYHGLGCRKDPEDLRDIPMGMVLPPIPLPPEVDHTRSMTPVRDQGDEGTCVAFASVVGVKEYQDTKEYKKLIELSPRYLYHLCKESDGMPDAEGTYPRIAMKALLTYGVAPESFWPYRPHQADLPRPNADKEAERYRIKAYARLATVLEMKRSLVVNGPFLAGLEVFESWFTKKVAKSGVIPLPKKDEELQGGHAVCVAGYDDSKRRFKFKNSWGTAWAVKGYGYLPYEYMKRYCMDAWSATDLIADPVAFVRMREAVLARFA